MSYKYLIIIIGIALTGLGLQAQDFNKSTGLGFHFGTSTGSGYSMRWMGEKSGIQGTFGAYTVGSNNKHFPASADYYYIDSDNRYRLDGRETAAILGVNYMYFLDQYKFGRFYVMAGGSYKYFDQSVVSMQYDLGDDLIPGSKQIDHNVQERWTLGAGPGFDWAISSKFRLSLEIPITLNWKHEIVMYLPSGGIYYYFK